MKRPSYKTIFSFLILCHTIAFAQQKSIAITIDDVPNISKYKNNQPLLLINLLDSLKIPFTIFVNEGKIYKTKQHHRNKKVLQKWIRNPQATVGNHTYNHTRYSEVGLKNFIQDIEQGENLTKKYATASSKTIKYFRFPFNDLGKDSIQHLKIKNYLKSKNYLITPFTAESSDWMFDKVYQYYLNQGDTEKAKIIGEQYVNKTIELIKFYDNMANTIYGRSINHIYLCHDNMINSHYLGQIITLLKQENYNIISLEESLKDPIYKQKNEYYKKWGISWLYRWMDTQSERIKWMKKEPSLLEIENTHKKLFLKD